MSKIAQFFPKSRQKWLQYFLAMYPVLLGTSLFAFNGFIDNFMVGKYNGVASVSTANTWTNMVIGLILGVAAAGGVVSAQLFGAKKYHSLVKMSKFRYIFTTSLVLILILLSLVMPEKLNGLFLKPPRDYLTNLEATKLYERNLEMANSYLRITTLQWLILSITGNMGNQLREIGHSRVTMYWGIGSVLTNISLNATLIYGFDLGVEGAAWASVASRIVELVVGTIYIHLHKLPLRFKIWTLFNVDKQTIKLFFRQFALFFSFASMIAIVNFRNFFYDWGYPQDSIYKGVGAAAVLGLTNAIMNVFTSVFAGAGVMAANFVGSELGKGNVDQAKINSLELKGFNTLVATCSSTLLAIIAIFIPSMTFLVNASDPTIDVHGQLYEVRNTLWVIALFFPLWIFYTTTFRNGVSGGKTLWFSLGDWLLNALQIGYVALVMGPMRQNSILIQNHFWLAYVIFFLSDFTKLIWQETAYKLVDWAQPIVNNVIESETALGNTKLKNSEPKDAELENLDNLNQNVESIEIDQQ